MKRIFWTFMLSMFYINNAHAIVSPNTVWEFLSTATASSVNGGGYDATVSAGVGVDGTRSAEHAWFATDVVIGAVNNTLTSVSAPFLSTHTGNVVHCTAGSGFNITTANSFSTILDVTGGVATLFSSMGTALASGGTCRAGGALMWDSTLADDILETFRSSNTAYMKRGNYNLGEAVTVATDAVIIPVQIIGYDSTRGDNPGTSMPEIDTGANLMTVTGDLFLFTNISFLGTGTGVITVGNSASAKNVKIRNTSATALRNGMALNSANKLLDSDFSSLNGTAISIGNNNSILLEGNYIHHSTLGVTSTNTSGNDRFIHNLFESIYSTGISYSGATSPQILTLYNTFIGTASGSAGTGIYIAGSPVVTSVYAGNIFTNYAIGVDKKHGAGEGWNVEVWKNNNFFNNTVNVSTTANIGDFKNYALDPQFVSNPAIGFGNYNIGANMKGIALPSGFGVSATTASIDMGAVQTEQGGTRSYSFTQ